MGGHEGADRRSATGVSCRGDSAVSIPRVPQEEALGRSLNYPAQQMGGCGLEMLLASWHLYFAGTRRHRSVDVLLRRMPSPIFLRLERDRLHLELRGEPWPSTSPISGTAFAAPDADARF